jgi:phenylalanyl-tRNA synthetase beta chain
MKFPFSMLQDFVTTSATPDAVGDLLTMAGFELEGIHQSEGDTVLDIKVVSNRGDGLSVLGLAREVLAKDGSAQPTELYRRATERFATDAEAGTPPSSVTIESPDCLRFSCRIFQGDFKQAAPQRVRQRLLQAGIRSISLLVDLTNYVMLEIGQPMHAYDLDTLRGNRIVVRHAREGEKLTTLDGVERALNPRQLVICDAERPVGVAGVMGGLDTEVTDATTRILLESANFLNTSVRRTRNQPGLSTEASYRFERSVDPEGTVAALNRFAELLAEVDGGKSRLSGVIDEYPAPPSPVTLQVRSSRASQLLGMEVASDDASAYLKRLGFAVEGDGGVFQVTAPTWRPDIVQEYDVIEEIGRVHGFEKIPEAPLQGTTTQGGVFDFDLFVAQVRDTMLRQGFVQNVSHSLTSAHLLDDPADLRVGPRNPNSPEMALLRNSILPGLADNARRNGGRDLHLFEIGAVFSASAEVRRLGVFTCGKAAPENWEKQPSPTATFFSLKAVVDELLRSASLENSWAPASDPRLHPTRQAACEGVALMGQIHPDIAEELDLEPQTFLAEIDLEALYKQSQGKRELRPISRNPSIRRDIAILIDKAVPYRQLEQSIREAAGSLLEKQWLFDVYEGKGIPEGKHSLAIALLLRKLGENLTDEEANRVRDRAVQALAALGASQR